MLLHNYLYRLKCIIRDKQTMFWTLLFPLLLATLFYLAFSNLSNVENFSSIKLGIVNNAEYQENTNFINALSAVSASKAGRGKRELFAVSYLSNKEQADKLLADDKIAAYIYFDKGLQLFVRESGINQTIIKSFLDNFKQSSSTMATVLTNSGNSVDSDKVVNSLAKQSDYLKEIAIGKSAPDNVVTYFYALIAMACLYGGFSGLKEVNNLQANFSAQAARLNVAPVHKSKLIISSMLAATTVQLFDIFVLLGYLSLILNIHFGSQFGYISLSCVIGTITGVTFGSSVSAIIKKSEGLKIGVIIGLTMLMSFLAGMMYDGMKYIISTKAPILGYLNPVNLISDSLYALYYYSGYSQFFTDITLLGIFAVVFSSITYLVLRRQQYASL